LGNADAGFVGGKSVCVALANTRCGILTKLDLRVPEGSHHQLESSTALADVSFVLLGADTIILTLFTHGSGPFVAVFRILRLFAE